MLSLLQSRREWPGPELAAELGVVDRTVRRDVERLRALGYPVKATTGSSGGYRLDSGRNLPPLVLEDDEAVAVVASLLTAAGGTITGIEDAGVRALAKLQQMLPRRLRQRVAAVGDAITSVVDARQAQVDAEVLAVLATACRDQERVTFDHRRRDGTVSHRRVEPHHVDVAYDRWYLIAFDLDRVDWRTFRLDRLTSVTPARSGFSVREVPGGDVRKFLWRTLVATPTRHRATAVVQAPAAVVRGRLGVLLPEQVEPRDDGSCVVRIDADSLDLIIRLLVSTEAEFHLREASPALVAHLGLVTGRLAAAHRDADAG